MTLGAPKRLTLTVPEAAKVLGVHVQTAYLWAHRGDLPVIRIGGRLLVKRAELERMLGSSYTTGTGIYSPTRIVLGAEAEK